MAETPAPPPRASFISRGVASGWGWLAFLVAAGLLLYRLGDPPSSYQRPGDGPTYIHDECYQAFTAYRYVRGDPNAWNLWATREDAAAFAQDDMTPWTIYEWVHPPTAKLVMAGFIWLLGFTPIAFRLGSVMFGLLTLWLVWRLATRMRGPLFGLLALLLLASDGLWFVFSRIAMNDIYATGCMVAAMYAAYRFWVDAERRAAWLAASGLLFSVGITMKWTAAPMFLGMAVITLGRLLYERVKGISRGRAFPLLMAAWIAGHVLAPPAIYLLSYTPYFLMGHSLSDFVALQDQIWSYHRSLKANHSQGSPWWQWPLMTQPVWMFLHPTPLRARVIYAMGNPLLWWSFLPALAYVSWRYLRRRDPADGLILCGFFGAWLPWAFVGRVAFIQYLLPGVPFGVLAVATVLRDVAAATRPWRTRAIGVYVALCMVTFLHFYPILSAWPVSHRTLASQRWFWFDRWRGY